MNFQSFSFLLFLAVTAIVCAVAGQKKPWLGRLLLMAACFLFVLMDGVASILVLCAGMVVTALAIQYLCGTGKYRRQVMVLACLYHIAVLMVFKYTAFFTGGLLSIGWVPLGLSFFTFQQLWLLKESYTRQYVPEQGDDLILYGLFFPSVTSGPILRPAAFFPQLRGEKFLRPDAQDVAAGIYAICCGTAKKVLLADPLGGVVNNGWTRMAELSAPAAWMVILAYTLQLYLDFSGYCDVAAGCARLLGIQLPVNFDSPYRALSVTEFWKRWHMTLTTFLRECLYFPLGGSKRGTVRAYINILIVFLVSGFWHGAGWTFLIWGGLHGLAQIVERLTGKKREILPKGVQWVLTFLFVNLAWVFFRAPDAAAAVELLKAAVAGGMALPQAWLLQGVLSKEVGVVQMLLPMLKPAVYGLLAAVLYGAGLLVALLPFGNTIRRMEMFRPTALRAVALGILMVWAILSFSGGATFIYSNF